MMKLFAIAISFVAVEAACPNSCSNHGTCSQNDICSCYSNWEGPDCSLRACPFGNSWALDAADPHSYEECSGAGLCDRSSGQCLCFEGYSGFSCQRRACPNDCSGNGKCRLLSEITTTVPYPSSAWDASQIQACVCDAGFFGTDCSQRSCATGDDPLTLCASTHKGQVQELVVSLGSGLNVIVGGAEGANTDEGMALFGVSDVYTFAQARGDQSLAQFRVGATDANGQVFYPPTAAKGLFAVDGSPDLGAQSLEVTLENIADFKVRNVHVTGQTRNVSLGGVDNTVLSKRYLVSFVPYEPSSSNYGVQQPLVCDSGYSCSSAGCAPTVKMPFLYRYAAIKDERLSFDAQAVSPGAHFNFYTGKFNTAADFAAFKFIRLSSISMPRLPPGMSVDTGISSTSLARYDVRVLVVVQDPSDPNNANNPVDVYWTKVIYGHPNIATDTYEYVSSSSSAGVWSSARQADFQGTLLGFTYRGLIPTSLTASVPDAPGVVLEFPATNLVNADTNFKFFEILVKLPSCSVTPLVTGTEFVDVSGNAITPVDTGVENAECSNRGQCNRNSGLCECFNGFYGIACSRQTTMV